MKSGPSALDLLIVSAAVWSLSLFALINAALGDCFGPDCPTEAERAAKLVALVGLSLLLQIAAAVWYIRARNKD